MTANGFLPHACRVVEIQVPGGPGVRFDSMLYPGYAIPPFYDSLLGKLIVWDCDRSHAIDRLKRALRELEISGVKTTVPLFVELADDGDVRAGAVHTRWLERWLEAKNQG